MKPTPRPACPPRPSARGMLRRAFTLLEVMVAIGAVALISLGLAKIFGATSQTLRTGKRVSHFNDTARALEATMRRDFSRLSRDGFLVIAHEQTLEKVYRSPADAGISEANFANPADPRCKKRRIDQIMFFAAGDFHTQRTPIYPSRIASGSQACIYYGHGLRQEPGTPSISVPCLDDRNRDGGNSDSGVNMDVAPWFGMKPGASGPPNPNQYASDWVLLRHAAVLAQPRAKAPPRPTANLIYPTTDQWEDNPIQIDLAPAQSSLFRNLARGTPATLPAGNKIVRAHDAVVARPLRSSGLVDVIATDLGEVRSIILDAQSIASQNPAKVFLAKDDDREDTPLDDSTPPQALPPVPFAFLPDPTLDGSMTCGAMKQWMLQALPAEPRLQGRNRNSPKPYPDVNMDAGGRMRCELTPPDYLGTQANNGGVYIGDEEYRRTDQTMLSASNFAPACTEFIVEWSFGQTYLSDADPSPTSIRPDPFLIGTDDTRADQLIWHGLQRLVKIDYTIPGLPLDPNDRIAGPYLGVFDVNRIPGQTTASPIDTYTERIALRSGNIETRRLPARVIHEPVNAVGLPDPVAGEPLYSLFGYVDPTFEGRDSAHPDRPDTIPCPWPRLIRITMTLADPADPTFEQTYQFVFEVPDGRQRGG